MGNADSACEDKVPYGDEEEGLFVTTLACKDPDAPVSRMFGGSYQRSFSRGFYGSNRRHSSSHGSSYGRGRYSSGGYRGSSSHHRSSYQPRRRYSSHRPSYGSSHHGSAMAVIGIMVPAMAVPIIMDPALAVVRPKIV